MYFDNISTEIEDNISIPISSLNKLRRNALDEIADKRDFSHHYTFTMPSLSITPANQGITEKRAEVKKIDSNISAEYDLVYVPIDAKDEDTAYLDKARQIMDNMIATQSTEVDTISGATFSSTGI